MVRPTMRPVDLDVQVCVGSLTFKSVGNIAHPNVVQAHRLVSRLAHLLWVAEKHNIQTIVEQPKNSVMFGQPRLEMENMG